MADYGKKVIDTRIVCVVSMHAFYSDICMVISWKLIIALRTYSQWSLFWLAPVSKHAKKVYK